MSNPTPRLTWLQLRKNLESVAAWCREFSILLLEAEETGNWDAVVRYREEWNLAETMYEETVQALQGSPS